MAMESAEISEVSESTKFWLLRMKLRRRSSICLVALGNRSLYKVFIMTISLSITGERIGLLQEGKKIWLKKFVKSTDHTLYNSLTNFEYEVNVMTGNGK